MLRPARGLLCIPQDDRQILVPLVELPEQTLNSAGLLTLTEYHAFECAGTRRLLFDIPLPVGSRGQHDLLTQKGQDHAQVTATLGRIIDQQNMAVGQHRRGGCPVSTRYRAPLLDSAVPHL